MDILSTYGRERMPTLFGKFVNDRFVQDDNITIRIYKNSAYNILEHGSEQYGALQDVKDAIRRLSQKDRDVNEKNDLKRDADQSQRNRIQEVMEWGQKKQQQHTQM